MVAGTVWICLSLFPLSTNAEQPKGRRGESRTVELKIWLTLPYMATDFIKPSGLSSSFMGGTVELYLFRLLTIEAGGTIKGEISENAIVAALIASSDEIPCDIIARAGVAPIVQDRRGSDGKGWVQRAGGLLGYRYLRNSAYHRDGMWFVEENHLLTVDGMFSATWWLGPHFGLSLRLTAGAFFPISQDDNGHYGPKLPDTEWGINFSSNIGVSF